MKKKLVIGGLVVVLLGGGALGLKLRQDQVGEKDLSPKQAAKEIYGKGKLSQVDPARLRTMQADNLGLKEAYDFKDARALVVRSKGAKGDMEIMVAFDSQGSIAGVRVLKHEETPAIGGKVARSDFMEEFVGASLEEDLEIDTISRATATSQSIIDSVEKARQIYRQAEGL